MNYLRVKRLLDITLALLALVVLSPILLLTALAIKLDSKGPVIFKQPRLGLNGQPFQVYKLRSMVLGAEHGGVYEAQDDPRVTRVGKILRRLSINELPQLFNVIKGDMSLIGPRPVLPFHPWPYSEYTERQKKRFSVKPGLTGWAQIHGRMNVPWLKRIEYDIEYADRLSFGLDLKIFFKTILIVLMMRDTFNKSETAPKPDADRS